MSTITESAYDNNLFLLYKQLISVGWKAQGGSKIIIITQGKIPEYSDVKIINVLFIITVRWTKDI